jgi:hypothetical protein
LRSPGHLVDSLVVDPRRPDRHRPGPDRHPTLPRSPVADHQPLAVLADLVGERRHVLVDLSLERRRDHPASTLPREIIERDATFVLLPDREPANI